MSLRPILVQTAHRPRRPGRLVAAVAAALLLAACASTPPEPAWQARASGAAERALAAQLEGRTRVQALEWAKARAELARTGRADWLARLELLRCAADAAALAPPACAAFEPLRGDAAAPERAYAEYLAGQPLSGADQVHLPAAQQALAALPPGAVPDAALAAIEDPLSRLVGAAVLLRTGRATPGVITQAVDTASAQGWALPLRAWLGVQLQRARAAGDADATATVQRRIALVEQGLAGR